VTFCRISCRCYRNCPSPHSFFQAIQQAAENLSFDCYKFRTQNCIFMWVEIEKHITFSSKISTKNHKNISCFHF
jgi:hypothetical protein